MGRRPDLRKGRSREFPQGNGNCHRRPAGVRLLGFAGTGASISVTERRDRPGAAVNPART